MLTNCALLAHKRRSPRSQTALSTLTNSAALVHNTTPFVHTHVWRSPCLRPLQLGFVHFMVEFAVIYKFRIGLFDFDELPPVGIWYISALLFLWFVSCFTVGVIPYQTEKCPHDPDLLSGAERRFDDKIVELENWIHCERWGERIKALRIEERVLEMQVEKDKHEGITGKETAKMQKYLLKEQQKAGFAVDKKKMTRIKKKGKGKSD